MKSIFFVKRRWIALLVMITFLITSLHVGDFALVQAEEQETEFIKISAATKDNFTQNYQDGVYRQSECNGADAVVSRDGNISLSYSTSSISSATWTPLESYWQIQCSTLGYKDVSFTFKARSSATGPKNFSAQYSTNGLQYYPVNDSSYSIVSKTLGFIEKDIALPEEASNQENLYIRLVLQDEEASQSGSTFASTGTTNINDITFKGIASAGGSTTPTLTGTLSGDIQASKASGSTLQLSDTIELSASNVQFVPSTEGNGVSGSAIGISGGAGSESYAIYYEVNNKEAVQYTEPILVKDIATPGQALSIKAFLTYKNIRSESVEFTYQIPISVSDINVVRGGESGVTYMVQGVVTFIDGKNVYVQDSTGAINVYLKAINSDVKVGNTVTATGTKGAYNGLEQLANATLIIDNAEVQTITPTKIKNVADFILNYNNYECQLVELESMLVRTVASSGNTYLCDTNGNQILLYKAGTEVLGDTKVGDIVNITAIVSDFKGLQLRSGALGKITQVYTELSNISDVKSMYADNEVTVHGTVNYIAGGHIVLEDATGTVKLHVNEEITNIAMGNYVVVSGNVYTCDTQKEVRVALDQCKVYKVNDRKVTKATVAEILAAPANYEGKYVEVEDAILGAGVTSVSQEDATIAVSGVPDDVKFVKGRKVDFTAIVLKNQENTVLQIVSDTDIEVKEAVIPEAPKYDPIPDELFTDGITNIKDAIAKSEDSYVNANKDIVIIGQVVTKYGSNGSLDSIILEDVVDNEIVALQIYDKSNISKYEIGDIVKVTGKLTVYGGVAQISSPTGLEVLQSNVETMKPQVVTIQELLDGKEEFLSEYVVLKNVTLGAYNKSNTPIKDNTISINLYKGPEFDGVSEGDVVDVYAVFSKYNTTYQLRAGLSNCYVLPGTVDVDSSITLPLVSWRGTSTTAYSTTTIFGDLSVDNDQLDEDAKLTLSTGEIPQFKVADNDYVIGSKGLTEGQYYQMTFPTKGYGNLNLSFTMRGSKTSAKYFNVLYSTDGTNFEKCNQISYTITKTNYTTGETTKTEYTGKDTLEVTTSNLDYYVELPDTLNHCDKVYIRLQVANGTPVDSTAIGTGGVNRFFNIHFTANPVITDDVCQVVQVSPEAGQIALNSELTMKTGTAEATIYYKLNNADYQVYDDAHKPVVTELPATVSVYAKKDQLEDSVVVTYGYTQAKVAAVKASPNGGAVKLDALVTLTCATTGAKIQYSLDNGETWKEYDGAIKLKELPMSIKAKATLEGYIDSEESSFEYTKRENDEYNIYFGQIHSHTEYSDGAGTCEQAFNYASTKAENIDFLAVTDHSNSFDNDTSATIKDGSVSSEWLEGHQLADQYTNTEDEENMFVGIYGYEMTWSGGAPGHMNTYNTEGFLSRNMDGYKNGSVQSLPNYYAQLKTVPESISMFNHPGTSFGDFYDFGYYDEEIDQLITLVEVGNGEGAIGSSGYFPSYEYYTRALDKGWHISPANNQDNHKGKWGDANTGRTVILADSLSRDNIYDALRNMRTYATEDDDLKLWYTLNGADMGTIFEEKPDTVQIQLKAEDPTDSAIGKVEVIVNGGLVAASKYVDSSEATVEFNLAPSYSYYYIRVTQPDGDLAVTAPVWISEVEAVGISSITTDASLAVSGEEISINTTLYNNEDKAFNIDSIVYTINGEVIHTTDLNANGLTSIPSKGEVSDSFKYTHNGLGHTEIAVTVLGTLNGVSKQYNSVLQLNYVSQEMVTRVLVDGTHNNDYVNGYYGGNVGNFADLAAKDYVKVDVVTEGFTKEMLDECSLLIISAPAKKTGTYNSKDYGVSHFEDEFIQLVKEYVEVGGNIILCGLADYQDSAQGQSSTEINKLLTAIGATMRLNSDELVDDVKNGGQAYRLYLNQFNMNSKYLQGVTPDQTYSAYSGCSILLDPENVAQGLSEALVMGHDSTYSIDSKQLDSNYVECEKGSLVALGHEQLATGSEVFLAGTVFLSNFEVKTDLDNAGDSYYANRNILLNILGDVKKELPTSTIQEMRQGDAGQVFAIEGWVTAGTAVEGNKFFDTIYVQDETAGTTVFPIADAGIQIGTKLRIVGYVDGYQGDKEIQVIEYQVLDDNNLNVIEPKSVSTKDAANYGLYGGSLLKVSGIVTRIVTNSSGVDYFYVRDESGVEARVFIDGYILASDGDDTINQDIKVGNEVSAIGLSYFNPDGSCLRVRDRAEVVLIKVGNTNTDDRNDERDEEKEKEAKILEEVRAAVDYAVSENKEVEVTIDLSQTGVISSSILELIQGTPVTLNIKLGSGVSCKISGSTVEKIPTDELDLSVERDVKVIPTAIITKYLSKYLDNSVLQQIALKHDGTFGFDATYSFDLTDLIKDLEDNLLAALYYYDEQQKQLVLQSISRLNSKNQASFNFEHASCYVLVVSDDYQIDQRLLDQVAFADGKGNLELYYNGAKDYKLHQLEFKYPDELQNSMMYGSLKTKVKYETSNSSVAVVSKGGRICAKGKGTATIIATITVQNQTIVLKRKVVVKKASIKITAKTQKLKVGEQIKVSCEVKGYNESDLVWTTKKADVAVVGKNTGKKKVTVKGKTAGKDTVIVKVKNAEGNYVNDTIEVEVTK